MADSSQYNLSLVITANNKAVEELNKLWKSVDNVKWWITQLSESTKKTLKTIWATATVVAWSVLALWKSFVDASMEAEPLQRSFERLSQSAQISSDEMLQAMRKASKWAVSDTKLMASANTALSLWVVKSADDMATLMEIARVKWQAMWRSMEEALDDIVRWLWRASPMILDNLWIVINQTEAQEEYAKSIGKTVDQLTEAEKKQALVNAVVRQWKKELAEAWEVPLTMAEKLWALNTQRENMKVQIWNALLPVLSDLLEKITPIIQKIVARVEENPKLTANILLVVGAVSWLVAILSWLALALPWITTAISLLTSKFTLLWTAVIWVRTGLNRLEDKVVSTDEKVAMYEASIEDLKKQLELWEITQEQFTIAVQEYNWKIEQAYADSQTFWQYLKDQLDDTLKVMTFDTDRRKQALQDFGIIFNAVWDMFDRIAEFLINTMIKARDEFWEIVNSVWWFFDNLVASMMNLAENGFTKLFSKVESLTTKFKNLISTIKEAMSMAGERVSWAVSSVVSFVSWKAWWWDVYWWQSYLVWEKWPELFTPSTRWTITPTNQITNNNGIEININGAVVRNDNDIQAIADEITRRIKLEKNFWIA